MKPNDYAALEKDSNFKKSYLSKTLWWKTLSMLPPVLIMFVGLAGLLYLFQYDKLYSLYAIPYVLLFAIGTIWLKALKTYLQKATMAIPGAFHVCLAATIGEKKDVLYAVFVNNTRRYDKYYITNLAQNISLHEILSEHKESFFKKAVLIHDKESDTDVYVKAYAKKDVVKQNAGWSLDEGYFPVLFIDEKNVPVIKRKDLAGKK
ncbi:MAG: hypothetical protein ACK5M3_14275 [Dysgonomonas sp.]